MTTRITLRCSLSEAKARASSFGGPFVFVLPSSTPRGPDLLNLCVALSEIGCMEICVVGEHSEKMHDEIDEVLEDAGLLDVSTTWFESIEEGREYMNYAANGGEGPLLVIGDDRIF